MNDAVLDRMVDGDLSPREQRELLSQLDDESGGWRRLALAFVEAQAWRNELGAMTDASRQPSRTLVQSGGSTPVLWRRIFAIAASVALAFGLGFMARGPRHQSPDQGLMATMPLAPPAVERELVGFPDGQTVDLPIVEATQVSPDWVRSRPNLVPLPVRRELERSGHRIEQRRVFLPLILDDGQPAVVPIDEAEVQFIGERVVQ
jgi:hypothetical protein